MTAQPDPGMQVAWRAERRRAARSHHPDLGGDAQEYLRVIAAIDARYGLCVDRGGRPPGPTHARTTTGVPLSSIRAAVRRWARRTRRLARTLPTRLPRSMPGARRYTTL